MIIPSQGEKKLETTSFTPQQKSFYSVRPQKKIEALCGKQMETTSNWQGPTWPPMRDFQMWSVDFHDGRCWCIMVASTEHHLRPYKVPQITNIPKYCKHFPWNSIGIKHLLLLDSAEVDTQCGGFYCEALVSVDVGGLQWYRVAWSSKTHFPSLSF